MEMIIILVSILQSVAISLGVGCSTLAIVNFFVAIADGTIDETERKMMGVVYKILRIAMILILITTAVITVYAFLNLSGNSFSAFVFAVWTLIGVLYLNSYLMTKKKMPSTIGPALQASTWYTLGIMMSLVPLGLAGFSYLEFIFAYAAAIALAVAVVNGMMSYLKKKKEAVPQQQ